MNDRESSVLTWLALGLCAASVAGAVYWTTHESPSQPVAATVAVRLAAAAGVPKPDQLRVTPEETPTDPAPPADEPPAAAESPDVPSLEDLVSRVNPAVITI